MFHVITQTPLNLPALMIEAMRETLNRSKAHLPFGMALTLVFRRFGVSFEGEATARLSHADTINQHTRHRMGFTRIDGVGSRVQKKELRRELRTELRTELRKKVPHHLSMTSGQHLQISSLFQIQRLALQSPPRGTHQFSSQTVEHLPQSTDCLMIRLSRFLSMWLHCFLVSGALLHLHRDPHH